MATKTKKLLEKEINALICKELKSNNFIVLNELRLHPAELDIVYLDLNTLYLTNIEIKRNNWKKLYIQAIRGKLYCHYSVAVLPISEKKNIEISMFSEQGIGVVYYSQKNKKIELSYELSPKLSDSINRNFKKIIYKEINVHYGDKFYA